MTAAMAARDAARRLDEAGVRPARREAVLLLRAVAGIDAFVHPDAAVDDAAALGYRLAVERRAAREPYAYIVGQRGFRHLEIAVDHRVLIPRPESELVVERAKRRLPPGGAAVDLCTGSGAIAFALAAERPDATVSAADLSTDALAIAARNRVTLGLPVPLFHGDLWDALPADQRGAFDVCTCNPPYVEASQLAHLDPEVRDWEPRVALVADEGWRPLYARLVSGAGKWLRPGGWLVAEVGCGQDGEVARIFSRGGLAHVAVTPDLARVPRVVEGQRPQ